MTSGSQRTARHRALPESPLSLYRRVQGMSMQGTETTKRLLPREVQVTITSQVCVHRQSTAREPDPISPQGLCSYVCVLILYPAVLLNSFISSTVSMCMRVSAISSIFWV